jgi:hypothetical protein
MQREQVRFSSLPMTVLLPCTFGRFWAQTDVSQRRKAMSDLEQQMG